LYSSVSKNYAEGYGTFWDNYFSATYSVHFHEQPPLMFFLQAIFFKLLGSSIYTERIYCLVAAVISFLLIRRCWTIISGSGKGSWLPVLFWFIMPVTFWAFTNNVEECTMSLFALGGMIHLLRALHEGKRPAVHLLLAGLFILLAGLTKGIQGMFLLAAPFGWWLTTRKFAFGEMVKQSLLVLIIPALFVAYAWIDPVVHASFAAYFNSRFVNTFNNVNVTGTRVHILYELFLDSLPVLFLIGVFILVTRRKVSPAAGWSSAKKLVLFFAFTALTGILPLMVTLEQRGFYLVTALPYVALALALIAHPHAQELRDRLSRRPKAAAVISISGILLLAAALVATVTLAGKPKRDAEKIHDLPLVAAITGERAILATASLARDWPFLVYAMRYNALSLTNDPPPDTKWLLLEKTEAAPSEFEKIPLETIRVDLYRKR
jgi:4-amino-4-deoxy-L-arabinose transferase-like glycosyltransferase